MEKITVAVVGGGAAGLFFASAFKNQEKTVIFERGERVGRKLAATGNGQGNVSNASCTVEEYFSSSQQGVALARTLVNRFDDEVLCAQLNRAGVLFSADARGRIYPTSKQASCLCDALRFYAEECGVELRVQSRVVAIEKTQGRFLLTAENPQGEKSQVLAKFVVLCSGGKAAKNFGTDGSAYALAEKFGHTITPLTPSLVQLKTELVNIKTLKGIKISDARVVARWQGGEKEVVGDLLFTDYGVSGDSIFRLSAYCVDKIPSGVCLEVDCLPTHSQGAIYRLLIKKRNIFPKMPASELLCGVVNNQLGRVIMRLAEGDLYKAAELVKKFPLMVKGSLGFDYAQVTKGGVSMLEVDENLQSKKAENLYFAGEILDIDGPCGGFNLQWAFSSACTVAAAIEAKLAKARGQV